MTRHSIYSGTAFVLLIFIELVAFAAEIHGISDFDIVEIERPRILKKAEAYLSEAPRTVTADLCERSQGGPHDYYSEGDYWWPDPEKPDGPYIRRDGETNPDNFITHRKSLVRLSDIIGTLTSAYLITSDEAYAEHAIVHLKAWFVDDKTRMNPNLLYGQAIKGRHSGRSIGIIDTIHLVEVARAAKLLSTSPSFTSKDQARVRTWFRDYLTWINTHAYGQREKHHPNNHGVCWSLQAAAFADLVGDRDQLAWIRKQFKTVYLKEMMDIQGGFPAELKRTKPYGYSLFVIDAMAGVAQIASTPTDDLWTFQLPDGRGMKKGMNFIVPYITNKKSWPWKPDVMYWDEWPVRHPSLLFAGLHFDKADYLATWEKLEADPKTFEVLRNLPLRHPLLWITKNRKGLAELAAIVRPGFLIGAHTKSKQLESGAVKAILRENYNQVSVGIYQKHTTQRKAREDWDFSTVDPVIEFAEKNGMTVYAHPMFGSDNYVPDWLLNGDFTDNELLDIIEERIKTILTRYHGRIHILDVYNEGLHRKGKGWREEENLFLRLGYHQNEYGKWPVALEKMLTWCRKYGGEDLKLIYNDNRNTLPSTQTEECIRLFKALKKEGIPIDGIGVQCHTQISAHGRHELNGHEGAGGTAFDAGLFARNLRAMGEAGIEVYISECDVHLYGKVDAEKLALQADAYRSMLKACIEEPACKAFKTWGFTDASCWKPMSRRNPSYKYEPYPLVFDHDLKPKPAYRAMQSLLIELAGDKAIKSSTKQKEQR